MSVENTLIHFHIPTLASYSNNFYKLIIISSKICFCDVKVWKPITLDIYSFDRPIDH